MSDTTKEQIIKKIKQEIPFIDVKPFSHNIISLELRLLEEKFGEEEVYNLINSTDLKYKGWGHIVLETDILNGKYDIGNKAKKMWSKLADYVNCRFKYFPNTGVVDKIATKCGHLHHTWADACSDSNNCYNCDSIFVVDDNIDPETGLPVDYDMIRDEYGLEPGTKEYNKMSIKMVADMYDSGSDSE